MSAGLSRSAAQLEAVVVNSVAKLDRRITRAKSPQEPVKSCKDPKKCARYLAKVLEECIPEVAVEVGNIMKWLREIAVRLAKLNRGMTWTTPAGFPVLHEIREPKAISVATSDHMFVLYEQDERRKIDVRSRPMGSWLTSCIPSMPRT